MVALQRTDDGAGSPRTCHGRRELDFSCRQWEATEDFRAGEGQGASWPREDGSSRMGRVDWSWVETKVERQKEPLVSRTVHCVCCGRINTGGLLRAEPGSFL
jgi:hypothetical protein